MTALCVRGRAGLIALYGLWAALFLGAIAMPAVAEEPIYVALDQARILKLPERASTVVIGDPLIADVAIEPGGIAVVTGKGYGATNVIVMDYRGAVLMEKMIEVAGPLGRTVVVYRGASRFTYSCTPDCSARITLGDDDDFFNHIIAQTGTRTTQALAAGAAIAGPPK